jgi:hypothetical protein
MKNPYPRWVKKPIAGLTPTKSDYVLLGIFIVVVVYMNCGGFI